ncbi:MAG: sigma-54-dependent transcriptional regulator [Mariprofundaceae bacterium]
MRRTVLVVDDNDINRLNLKLLLKDTYQVIEAGNIEASEQMLSEHRIDLMVLDLALPPEPDNPEIGMAYLKSLRSETPDIPVVVITGHDERNLARRARQLGALDFFTKPFHPDEVRDTIDRSMATTLQRVREQELERLLETHLGTKILGTSSAICTLKELIERVAPTPSSVLIRGETGSGKELVARQLHSLSQRTEGPFIGLNCASMGAEHLESELFGYEKGAYAGASKRKLGWFERASGGTLFLDEISGLPPAVQAKLLRVLENGEFSRLGGEAQLRSDVRLICSTKQNLEALVRNGSFREDLYYRIHVVDIEAPPLREHVEDVPLLARYFLERKTLLCNKQIDDFSAHAMQELMTYSWPGNVRELENVVERTVVLAEAPVVDRLPFTLTGPRIIQGGQDLLDDWLAKLPDVGIDAESLLADFEKKLLLLALKHTGGVKAKAGRWLGFGERSKDKMRYLCDKYQVDPQEELQS